MSEQTIQVKLKKPHNKQAQVLREAKRWNVLKCGRRFGKTTLAEELLLSPDNPENGALNGFPVAYGAPTYKMLMETWRQVSQLAEPFTAFRSEQEKRIELFGGGVIDFWSLEEPDAIRGRKYKRFIIDEAEYVKNLKQTWELVIRATLLDLRGDAFFFSTPKFGSTYFKELSAIIDDNWKSWRFTTYDNPKMPVEEIREIQRTLDEASFRCEYLAEDVDLAVNKWIYVPFKDKIVPGLQPVPGWPIILSFDFNVEPIVCLAGQVENMLLPRSKVLVLDEFRLMNSDIDELCQRILAKYSDRMLLVTGDASGQNRTALKRDLNFYKEIQRILGLTIHQFKIPPLNPPIKNTRVLCNSLLQRHPDYWFSDRVPYLMTDLEKIETDQHGNIDKSKDKHLSHLLDAWRYFNWTFLRTFLDLKIYNQAA